MTDTQYATITQLKLDIQKTDTDSDVRLQALLNAAAFCIDHWMGRKHKADVDGVMQIDTFLAPEEPTVRIYGGRGGYYQYTEECCEYTLVEQKDSPTDDVYDTLDSDDWVPFAGSPEDPDYNSLPYHGILISATGGQEPFTSGSYSFRPGFTPSFGGRRNVPTLRITGRFGYALEVPPVVNAATILLASRWYKRGQSAWSDVLATAEAGLLLYRQKKDPDICMMLEMAGLFLPSIGRKF